jgi:hypothetical protein
MFWETKLAVFVLDKRKKPLVPCSKKRARLLLTRGRALVPLTIRLQDRIAGEVRPLHAHQELARGFKSGDEVRADVPTGTRKGVHIGRVAVRESGSFNIGKAQHLNWKSCQFIQRADGYGFAVPASPVPVFGRTALPPRLPATVASGGF